MRLKPWLHSLAFGLAVARHVDASHLGGDVVGSSATSAATNKTDFIDSLVSNMTVEDLVLQLHLMFADDIIGTHSDNRLYDETMRFSPESPIGVMHDWYPMNKTYYNTLQQLQLDKAHLEIPMMLVEECLHGVGSFKQSVFPQNIGMAASWDTDIVHRVGRAIGTEARSIGIHGCFSPVLDLGQDPRWGRVQEAFGEDKILTSHIGVAYASGLSKNSSWSEPDAVYPIMKHFAAHGVPRAGLNAAPYTGHGPREILQDMLIPFKAVYELGGARGVMMAYNEIDGVPAAVHPMLYQALEDWEFDGFTLADDLCMKNLLTEHAVAGSQADAMQQWFNAGGMIDFYDWDLESYLKITKDLVANDTVPLKTLQSHVRNILSVKYDLGLFTDALIPDHIDPDAIVASHEDVALEAAHKSIVLLKNDNHTLPLSNDSDTKIALIGPFADTINLGDYTGALGQLPIQHASTIRQGMERNLKAAASCQLHSSWGSNSWEYNNQYAIPPYLLSTNGTAGGLQATYFADTNFTTPAATRIETPAMNWGLYPPPGLPSNNFSAIWEGELTSPVDVEAVDGWIGVAITANTTMRLLIDGKPVVDTKYSSESTILGNIEHFDFVQQNGTLPPLDGAEFTFRQNKTYHVRIEYQAWDTYKKTANVNSINSQVFFWWNLVSPGEAALEQAVSVAQDSDVIVLAVGAAWNSDGESGDRATLDLAPSQDALARAMFDTGKPVVLVLQGGRPFAIPEHYRNASAVLSTFFGGQAAGQGIADVLFGAFNPGGRVPITVPYAVGQIPAYYNYKPSAHAVEYLDIPTEPSFAFGHGLSYTTFSLSSFSASSSAAEGENSEQASKRRAELRATKDSTFTQGDVINFSVDVKNNGTLPGSYVAQVYLLGRVSTITQPLKQLVAFERVYLDAQEQATVTMPLDVDRYLMILNRKYEWELEKGEYTFAVLENGGSNVDTGMNITMNCV